MIKISFFALLCALITVIIGCNANSGHSNSSKYPPESKVPLFQESEVPNKPDDQIAEDVKNELLNNGIDTVLCYQRTCINCCDFYTLFWIENNRPTLYKIYFNPDDNKKKVAHLELDDDSIFKELNASYSNLKKTVIKDNTHKMEDGTSTIVMSSHYCYSSIAIYTQNDSVFSNRMKDTDFLKNSGGDPIGPQKVIPNDNYQSNINSKWYALLLKIEKEISFSPWTSEREREIMRKHEE